NNCRIIRFFISIFTVVTVNRSELFTHILNFKFDQFTISLTIGKCFTWCFCMNMNLSNFVICNNQERISEFSHILTELIFIKWALTIFKAQYDISTVTKFYI